MKIVADENMPLVAELFSPHGEVCLVPGRSLGPAEVSGADVLLVRSVTAVNSALLKDSRVRFVGSATIGTDHLDLGCLAARGIPWSNAPGCNADAVVNYVLAALCVVDGEWRGKTLGIVGCGNVGSRLYRALKRLGVSARCYDPFLTPRQQAGLCGFEQVLGADVLCLHTPLTTSGPFPTLHMFDGEILDALRPGALILNAGRGGVVDSGALRKALKAKRLQAILDVWENEPDIDRELMSLVSLGTPHIAGYSLEGRIRGTVMVYQAFCRWLGIEVSDLDAVALANGFSSQAGGARTVLIQDRTPLCEQIRAHYDPRQDYQRLLAEVAEGGGESFDRLRKDYPLRREFTLR